MIFLPPTSPLYFSVVRSASSTSAGLHLLPQSIGLALGSLLAGYLIRSTGRSALLGIVSLALPIASAITMARWNEHTPSWVEWIDISPAGLGYSSYLVTSLIAIISSVPKEMIPRATAISYLFRTLGGCLGVALFATLQQEILGRQLAARITGPGSKKVGPVSRALLLLVFDDLGACARFFRSSPTLSTPRRTSPSSLRTSAPQPSMPTPSVSRQLSPRRLPSFVPHFPPFSVLVAAHD